MRLLEEGLLYRSWPTALLLRFDDLDGLEHGGVRARGRSWRLPGAVIGALREELEPAPPPRDLDGLRAWLALLSGRPHGPRRAAERLLAAAAAVNASDVHLEADVDGWMVRVRLAGELLDAGRLNRDRGARLIAALKGLAGVLPYRSDVVQEGRIPRPGVCADVRASFAPTAMGERAALRLFGRLRTLDQLGLTGRQRAAFAHVLGAPTGLILVAGASGAGKTTTLYAALAHVAATRRGAHLSLEDPVEQRLRVAGIAVDQIELDPARGLTAEALLAASLRQDVDVLCVGELRTAAEAALAVQAAHTGRLVLAGVHAGSVADARQRLLDLGAEPRLLAGVLRAILFQQLRRTACGCDAGCEECGGGRQRRLLEAELQEGLA